MVAILKRCGLGGSDQEIKQGLVCCPLGVPTSTDAWLAGWVAVMRAASCKPPLQLWQQLGLCLPVQGQEVNSNTLYTMSRPVGICQANSATLMVLSAMWALRAFSLPFCGAGQRGGAGSREGGGAQAGRGDGSCGGDAACVDWHGGLHAAQ
jgi:hypothetical protein